MTEPRLLRLLQVEDNDDDAELVRQALHESGFRTDAHRVENAEQLAEALRARDWDLVVSDYSLPAFDALHALAIFHASGRQIPFIIASGCIGEEEAVAAIKAGADDFVMKSNLARLPAQVERSLRECATRKAHDQAIAALHESEGRFKAIAANLPGLVFQSVIRGDGRTRFLYVSDQCKPLLGLDADAMLNNGSSLLDMVVSEDRASFLANWQSVMSGTVASNWEGRVRVQPHGDLKWINMRASHRRLPSGDILSEGIISNITQSKTWERELIRSQEQLRELSSHLQAAKEQERAHIARELHDELGSTLTAIKIELLSLASRLPEASSMLAQKAASATALLDHAMDTVRSVSRRLRPGVLDYGLQAAVEWQAREFQKRMGILCELSCDAEDLDLSADSATAMFRVFQEALTNIAKHAQAGKVRITLASNREMLLLEVEDDGRGIADGSLAKLGSFGIRNMRERIEALDGEFDIGPGGGGGTRICVTIPLPGRQLELPGQEVQDDRDSLIRD